jgi:hypothetical protein
MGTVVKKAAVKKTSKVNQSILDKVTKTTVFKKLDWTKVPNGSGFKAKYTGRGNNGTKAGTIISGIIYQWEGEVYLLQNFLDGSEPDIMIDTYKYSWCIGNGSKDSLKDAEIELIDIFEGDSNVFSKLIYVDSERVLFNKTEKIVTICEREIPYETILRIANRINFKI